ncbi:MAG: alpha/beta hydrolase [Olsenella sp.]|jgi:acetyl esterase/lipase
MGAVYEVLSTPAAYLMPAYYDAHPPLRSTKPTLIPFGRDRLQHVVVWEPEVVTHAETVVWFHGGGYLVGTSESMNNAADVYNAQGYRFASVGFRLMPWQRFPAQVYDAFVGVRETLLWLSSRGEKGGVVVGGSSAGGMSAALVAYDLELQKRYGLDGSKVLAFVSCAAVLDAADMLVDYAPPGPVGTAVLRSGLDLPGCDVSDRDSVRAALRPFSPLDIVRTEAVDGVVPPVPYFGVHGVADETSPIETERAFAAEISRALGPSSSTLHEVEDPRWQHMVTTVTMHKRQVETDPVLSHLFSWLDDVL